MPVHVRTRVHGCLSDYLPPCLPYSENAFMNAGIRALHTLELESVTGVCELSSVSLGN